MVIIANRKHALTESKDRQHSFDRWASRRRRALRYLRQHGIGGVISSVREAGPRGTAQFFIRQARYSLCIALGKQWDRKHHVDTGGQIDVRDINVVGPNADLAYPAVSTSPSTFAHLSQFFPSDRSKYTFVDLGCAKGRTLLLASGLGFNCVVGIEFAETLCEIARKNIAQFPMPEEQRKRCRVEHQDATRYELPDGKLVLYFGNPFGFELWPIMIANIARSLANSPRPMRLILAGSLDGTIGAVGNLIAESKLFARIAQGTAPFFLDTYRPYRFEAFDAFGE